MNRNGMQQPRDALRTEAVLVLPGDPSADLSAVADPVRIPVRIVWPERADTAAPDAPSG